ncbi:MAG: nitroreductase family protein [bacterium]|nr:nitroreductase family protein [bacterium]
MEKVLPSAVLETIKKRYSCRRYRPDPVEKELMVLLEEAIKWAPSACNRQPYTFHFITGKGTISGIAEAVPLGPASVNAWIKTAPVIVAAVGKPELVWHKMTQVIDTDYHRTDAIIAMDHLSLVAAELGLGTCWVGWFHRKKVGKFLGIPRNEEVVILMTLGHPDRDPPKERKRKEISELIARR